MVSSVLRSLSGALLLACAAIASQAAAAAPGELYRYVPGVRTVWFSPENRSGRPGAGGVENEGAKGHAWDNIEPSGSYVLADVHGAGTGVRRLGSPPGYCRSGRPFGLAKPAASGPLPGKQQSRRAD